MSLARALKYAAFATLAALGSASADMETECNWSNDPQSTIASCSALLGQRDAAKPWMYFNRGLAYKMRGEPEKALADYSKAIELDPAFGAAYTNRGNVRLLLNDLKGAMADFRRAIQLDPSDDIARQNLAAIQTALRKVGASRPGKGVTGPAR